MKRKYLTFFFIIAILLLTTIATAGLWQDITGKVPLFLFRQELRPMERPAACAHSTEPAEVIKLLDMNDVTEVVLHPTRQSIMYAEVTPLMSPPSLYRSADSGRTWQFIGHYRNVAVNKIQPNRVYASRENRIYESLDYGSTFRERDALPISADSGGAYITTIFTDRFDWKKVWIGTRTEQYGVFLLDLSNSHAEFKHFNFDAPPGCSETFRKRLIGVINQDPADRNILYFVSEDSDHDFYWDDRTDTDPCPGTISPQQFSIIRTLDGGNTFQTFSGNADWHGQNIFPVIEHGETKWYFAIEGNRILITNGSDSMQWDLLSSTPLLGNEAYWDYRYWQGWHTIASYIDSPLNRTQQFVSAFSVTTYPSMDMEVSFGFIWQFNPNDKTWTNILSIPGTIISDLALDNCGDNLYFSTIADGVYVIRNIHNGDIAGALPYGYGCSPTEDICCKLPAAKAAGVTSQL